MERIRAELARNPSQTERRRLASLLLWCAAATTAAGAAPPEVLPTAWLYPTQALEKVPSLVLPDLDRGALAADDSLREIEGLPPRFAVPVEISIDAAESGLWESLDARTLLWRFRIRAPGARSINLAFERFRMPEGGQLLLYSADGYALRGPFTSADNADHGELWTPVVATDDLVVEATIPASRRGELELVLGQVGHGYRAFVPPTDGPQSGSCNMDVECLDGSDPWRDNARAVAVYTVAGTWTCTGSLLNNTAQNQRLLFMTARHCGVTPERAPSVVAYWNYRNSSCRTPGSAESGGPGDGQLSQFYSGARFRASFAASDFTLVEFTPHGGPRAAFDHYWAGWNRSDQDAPCSEDALCAGLHHPRTDEMRITFSELPALVDGVTDLWVRWDDDPPGFPDSPGVTEPGSSGSPFYDADRRFLGQLRGGPSRCGATGDELSDFYGRLAISWGGAGTRPTQAAHWLDPLDTGVVVLDGRNYQEPAGPPAAPTDLGIEEALGYRVALTWIDSSVDETGFRLERDDGGGWFVVDDQIPADSERDDDFVPAPPGESSTHAYRVSGFNAAGSSPPSNEIQITMYRERPPVPTPLRPSGCTPETRPEFAWSAVPRAHTYYLVATRQSDGSNPINQPGLTVTQFRPGFDLELEGYLWKVKACNNQGCSSYTSMIPFEIRAACASTVGVSDVAVAEGPYGPGSAVVALSLTPARGEPVTVRYATADATALAGSDYLAASGIAGFAPGQTATTVTVPLLDDGGIEGLERFSVVLSQPTGDVVIPDPVSEVTVVDDDAPLANTVGAYRPSNGTFYLRLVNTTGIGHIAFQYGIAGDVPIVGDWDGDGDDTIGIWRPSNQSFYLRNSNDTGIHDLLVAFGIPGDRPITGDWDGDGDDEIGVYRPSTSTFYLRHSNLTNDPYFLAVPFGAPGDLPVTGDWNGDGRDTIGVYGPDRHFRLRNENAPGPPDLVAHYGSVGDFPVTGDWNGDGFDSIGIRRPSRGSFFLKDTIETGVADYPEIQYGNGLDQPIVGNWTFP